MCRPALFVATLAGISFGLGVAARADAGDVSIEQTVRQDYGDPCKRKANNYLPSEYGRPCVPLLTAGELKELRDTYYAQPPARRPYVRFTIDSGAYTIAGHTVTVRKMYILDAYPSTSPMGLVPSLVTGTATPGVISMAFPVIGSKRRLVYDPGRGRILPVPP
jgi:hypothetical protein